MPEDKAERKYPGNYTPDNQHIREKVQKEEEQRRAAEEERRKVAEEIRKARESARERLRLAQVEREQKSAAKWTEALSRYRMRWADMLLNDSRSIRIGAPRRKDEIGDYGHADQNGCFGPPTIT